MIRAALEQMAAAGVAFATRGEQPIDRPPHGGDVDILVGANDISAADCVLRSAGFGYMEARGHRGHRFYLGFDPADGRWLKVDVSIVPERWGWDLRARDAGSLGRFAGYRVGEKASPGRLERVLAGVGRRMPLSGRRKGAVVAVLGPDGAGKGSVIAALRSRVPVDVTGVYLGYGLSVHAYSRRRRESTPGDGLVRVMVRRALGVLPSDLRETQHRVRQLLATLPRLWMAYVYAWRGHVVLCDRHPLEDLAVGPPPTTALRRAELALLRTLLPWPDAVIVLDAPAEVLFQRKGEQSPVVLDQRRAAYREVFVPRGAMVVTTGGRLDDSVSQASAVLWNVLRTRRGW